MKQATKKELGKHAKVTAYCHSEGKHWCDCLTRGYRHWLGIKLHGTEDIDDYEKESRK